MQNLKSDVKNKNIKKRVRLSVFFLVSLMIFSLLIPAACDSDKNPGQTVTEPTKASLPPGRLKPGERDHVAFILAGSIKSDYGKNSYHGLQLISAANAEIRYVENVPVSAAEEIVGRLIRAEYNVIFFDSAIYSEAALDIAANNPDIMFFVVEGTNERENLINIAFREEEQSFLLGAVTSIIAPDNSIGLIAKYPENIDKPLIEAFEAGAKHANPTAEVHSFDLDSEQTDASIQTEQLIDMYEPTILAVMAGDASESAMYVAREAGLRIVSSVSDIKLLSPVAEQTIPDETDVDPDATDAEPEEETTVTQATTAPTANTVPSWSPGATRNTISDDDPNLYDPASVKVLLKRAEAYLYAYDLFRNENLPVGTIYCGVKEELITVEDFASDIDASQTALIENVIDVIAQGDVSIPR